MDYNRFIERTREQTAKEWQNDVYSKPVGQQAKAIISRIDSLTNKNKDIVK